MNEVLTAVLEKLKAPFIELLAQQCGIYVTIGTREESPRWFQYRGDKNVTDNNGWFTTLHFGHSQRNSIWIDLPLTTLTPTEQQALSVAHFNDIYSYFKEVKYKYLADKWPTIEIPKEYLPKDVVSKEQLTRETTDKRAGLPKLKSKNRHGSKEVYLLGKDADGIRYWLEAPSWDCGWYWGFGYVETYERNAMPSVARDIDSHSHIDSSFIGKHEYYDAKSKSWRLSEYIHNIYDSPRLVDKTFTEAEGWELSELFKQFYFLKEAAENFGRGKCHTANTSAPKWEDKDLAKKINEVLIPGVTNRILEILSPSNKSSDNEK